MQSRPEEAPGCNGRFDVVVECAMPRDAERRRGYEGEIGNAGKFLRWGWGRSPEWAMSRESRGAAVVGGGVGGDGIGS